MKRNQLPNEEEMTPVPDSLMTLPQEVLSNEIINFLLCEITGTGRHRPEPMGKYFTVRNSSGISINFFGTDFNKLLIYLEQYSFDVKLGQGTRGEIKVFITKKSFLTPSLRGEVQGTDIKESVCRAVVQMAHKRLKQRMNWRFLAQ